MLLLTGLAERNELVIHNITFEHQHYAAFDGGVQCL